MVCGTAERHACRTFRHGTICAACGVATTTPWPTDAELERAYGGPYRPSAGRFAGPGDALLRRSRGRLARRLDRLAPPGPILDVGAGDGALVNALAHRGRDVTGLERRGAERDIRAGDIGELDGEWAAIVFWHSLEHLPRRARRLDRAARLWRPAGSSSSRCPNSGQPPVAGLRRPLVGARPPPPPRPCPGGARCWIACAAGLRVERVSHLRGGQVLFGWLHGLVGALPGTGDLYDAIRRPEARQRRCPRASGRRARRRGLPLPLAAVAPSPRSARGAAAASTSRRAVAERLAGEGRSW